MRFASYHNALAVRTDCVCRKTENFIRITITEKRLKFFGVRCLSPRRTFVQRFLHSVSVIEEQSSVQHELKRAALRRSASDTSVWQQSDLLVHLVIMNEGETCDRVVVRRVLLGGNQIERRSVVQYPSQRFPTVRISEERVVCLQVRFESGHHIEAVVIITIDRNRADLPAELNAIQSLVNSHHLSDPVREHLVHFVRLGAAEHFVCGLVRDHFGLAIDRRETVGSGRFRRRVSSLLRTVDVEVLRQIDLVRHRTGGRVKCLYVQYETGVAVELESQLVVSDEEVRQHRWEVVGLARDTKTGMFEFRVRNRG